jgi:poly-gamma-glutamate capsule biosynthesis protein CapA/YwtB (metallophosphatase superfamily)
MSAPTSTHAAQPARQSVRLFLCGDVMIGRGIDQVLPHPCDPVLHERYVRSAMDYVWLAEKANGAIPRASGPAYIWGAALDELNRMQPDARIINLETSITRSEDYARKGINYRVSPENADCLLTAAIDCCVVANNHVLDWGRSGLLDTLAALKRLKITTAGAGRNLGEASAPAVFDIAGKGRVLVYSFASVTSGVFRTWAATPEQPGVNLLPDLTEARARRIANEIASLQEPHDIIVVSIHWGSNWSYDIPDAQRRFAHTLIDNADVSVIHGHSSHHAKAIEVHGNRLVLYGCGDFLDDYEGISGYEDYRDDLVAMYFVDLDPMSGDLIALELIPLQIQRFQLVRPSIKDVDWLQQRLERECNRFATRVAPTSGGYVVSWPSISKGFTRSV